MKKKLHHMTALEACRDALTEDEIDAPFNSSPSRTVWRVSKTVVRQEMALLVLCSVASCAVMCFIISLRVLSCNGKMEIHFGILIIIFCRCI